MRNGKVPLTKYIQMFGYALSEHEPSQSHIVLGTLAGHEADTCICLATLIIPCTFAEFERNQISVVCLLFLRKMAEKIYLITARKKKRGLIGQVMRR